MVCFVILHYEAYEETVTSVNSIFDNVVGDKKVIIVDNCSPNKSGEKLIDLYSKNKNVNIILSKQNIGFARGNNLGYEYAINHYNPDFIVVMNNDVEIVQKDFIKRINDIYKEEKYFILSPDIYSTFSKIHQSPKRLTSFTYLEFEKNLKKYRKRNKSIFLIPIKCFIKEIKPLKKFFQNLKFRKKHIDYSRKYYNVPIHGACFIFSKKFLQKRKKAFFEGTFMYFESEILDYECHKNKFKTLYDPSIIVYHHHSISSQNSFSSELKRERFVNKCVENSISSFLISQKEKNK